VSVRGQVGLLVACDDPALLNFPLWGRQREILQGIENGPRLHVLALGRRSGKTTLAALVALWSCLLRPELLECLRPGERGYAVAAATNIRQARLFTRAALSIVEHSPLLAEMVESVSEDEITFRNGTALAAFPCTSRGGRGFPIFALLLDEAAHMLDSEGNSAAEPMWRSLAPSTAQFGDASRVIVASTPFGTEGFFASLYAKADSGELADAAAVTATSAEVNPTLDPSFLSREHDRDPEGFRGEYMAEFIGGGGAFLDPRRIADAVADRDELFPDQANLWVAGLDPAFSSDPFGLALVGRDPENPARLVLGLACSWMPQRGVSSFEERRHVEDTVLAEVGETCRRYGATVVTDQHAAPAVIDRLRRMGLNVRLVAMTAQSKTAAYTELRAKLYTDQLELYDHPDLLAELRRLRTKYAAGSASVVTPRVGGSHGDIAQALAVAVLEHATIGSGSADGAAWYRLPVEDAFGFGDYSLPARNDPL
jgi:hypothetical protein